MDGCRGGEGGRMVSYIFCYLSEGGGGKKILTRRMKGGGEGVVNILVNQKKMYQYTTLSHTH